MDGLNYPLIVKLLYLILIISAVIVILHPDEVKKAVKQTKLEEYFKKIRSINKVFNIKLKNYILNYFLS